MASIELTVNDCTENRKRKKRTKAFKRKLDLELRRWKHSNPPFNLFNDAIFSCNVIRLLEMDNWTMFPRFLLYVVLLLLLLVYHSSALFYLCSIQIWCHRSWKQNDVWKMVVFIPYELYWDSQIWRIWIFCFACVSVVTLLNGQCSYLNRRFT